MPPKHEHHSPPSKTKPSLASSRQFRLAILGWMVGLFFVVELVSGHVANSVALVADAFHMLSDVLSILVAYYAIKLAKTKKPTSQYTYGWQRAEVLGALVNAVFLLALCFTIILDAIQRFYDPTPLSNPLLVLIVGCVGLAVNIGGLFLFHEHHHHGHGGHDHHDHSHPHHSHKEHHGHSHKHKSGDHEHHKHLHHHDHHSEHDHDHSTVVGEELGGPNHHHHHSGHDLAHGAAEINHSTISPKHPLHSHHARSITSQSLPNPKDKGMMRWERMRPRSFTVIKEDMEGSSSLFLQDDDGFLEFDEQDGTKLTGTRLPLPSHPAQVRADIIQIADQWALERQRLGRSSVDSRSKSPNMAGSASGPEACDHSHEHDHAPENGSIKALGNSHSHAKDLNMHGVFLHVAGDALGSVGVIIASLIVMFVNQPWTVYVDPITSILIAGLIIVSTVPLVKSTLFILLQGVPGSVKMAELREEILRVPEVMGLHEFHVWQLSDTKLVASIHVLVAETSRESYMRIAVSIKNTLHEYGIHSTTIQPEFVPVDRLSSPSFRKISSFTTDDSDAGEDAAVVVEVNDHDDVEDVGELTCLLQCSQPSCEDQVCCPPTPLSPAAS